MAHSTIALTLVALVASSSALAGPRSDWYWHSPVNIHWDNHSRLLGKGMSADEIAGMFAG